jgi:hypothetical protein
MPIRECWIDAASKHRFPNVIDRLSGLKLSDTLALAYRAFYGSVSIVPDMDICPGQLVTIATNVSDAFSHNAILAQTARGM